MQLPQISEAEWQVMNVIWNDQPLTSQEIVAQLIVQSDWSPTTIKTMLHRLVKKEALTFEKEGNRYLYRALVSRQDSVKQESQSFLDRVFGGNTAPLLSHFVNSGKLTPDQISELKQLLEEQEGQS